MTKPTERIYHSRIPNINIHVFRGPGVVDTILFAGDTLLTSDPDVIEFCDAAADKPGSYIYTKTPQVDPAEAAAHQSVLSAAQVAHDKVVKSGEIRKE